MFIKKNSKSILASFVLSFSLFLLYPLSISYQNIDVIDFNLKDILPIFILIACAASVLFSFFVTIISKRKKYLPLILTAFSICLWIQGNFIKYDLVKLDGHQIPWAELFKNVWIEVLVWLVVFEVFIYFRKILNKNLNGILFFHLLLITLPIIWLLINNSGSVPVKSYLDKSKEFQYSENNVLIIILDNYAAGAFQEIIDEHPENKETFKDFIFFRDAVGGYTTTKPSIPYILTGEHYQNLTPFNDYLESVKESTISNQLKQHGYTIESYPYVPIFSSIYDNQTDVMPSGEKLITAMEQMAVSGIRYSPLVFKPIFVTLFYKGIEPVHNDMVVFNSRVSDIEIVTSKPLFKLIHFSGAHAPIQLDSSLKWHNAGYLDQAAGNLLLLKNLLAELKKAGVYDNSLIIIFGDHGHGKPINFSTFPLSSFAQPLLLAKRVGQQFDNMQISEAPVTTGDLPITISRETHIDVNYDGYSIFDQIPETRIRNFYYYTWNSAAWSTKYLPTFYGFEITGQAKDDTSWKYIGKFEEGHFDAVENIEDINMIKELFSK